MEKLIITVGITGSRITRKQTPYIPILPEEIARSGIEAWRAGASVLHVHVRDTDDRLGNSGYFHLQGGGRSDPRRNRCHPLPYDQRDSRPKSPHR